MNTELNEIDLKLDAPYLSQYRDISNTINAHRACGMTCIKMVLDYHKIASQPLEDLVSKYILDQEAYSSSGWKHDFFVSFLNDNGLSAFRKEKMDDTMGVAEIAQSVKNQNPVLVSVEQRLFDKKLFHIILMVGIRTSADGEILVFFYHYPGRLTHGNGANQYVPLEIFKEYWRRMAIFTNTSQ